MIRTLPAPRVAIVPARDEARPSGTRKIVNRIVLADEVDPFPGSPADLLARTRVERAGHFQVPRFS